MRARGGSVPDGNDLTAAVRRGPIVIVQGLIPYPVIARRWDVRIVGDRAMFATASHAGDMRMRWFARCVMVLFAIAAHAGAPDRTGTPDGVPGPSYKAVLIAGDRSAAAFDHATEAMRDRLLAGHAAPGDIQRLSASRAVIAQDGAGSSSLGHVLAAIERMHPAADQGCFVFATSHGGFEEGLVLVPSENYLTPEALDEALTAGCGDAPTVAIISGCFSGGFTKPPMARANRIILTAAREDRPSFGCGAGFHYTVYDRCLLQAMDHASTWRAAYAMITGCVTTRERELDARPSGPQAWFGASVEGLRVPGRP
jgi:hypothetical protein